MPALNFKKEFADMVADGTKRQTIRKYRKDGRPHCKVGDELKLYTGMRTKNCRLLGVGKVRAVDDVVIYRTFMKINGVVLPSYHQGDDPTPTDNDFAINDGFGDFEQMVDYFLPDALDTEFRGVIIEWVLNECPALLSTYQLDQGG